MGATMSRAVSLQTGSRRVHLIPPEKPTIPPLEDEGLEIPDLFLDRFDEIMDLLNRAFQELKSKHDDVRVKAAHDVYAAVVVAAQGE